MKYNLISYENTKYSAIKCVLMNRGISKAEVEKYLNTTDADICDAESLGEQLLQNAIILILKIIKSNGKVCIIVDCDCDGYTSSAALINYLHCIFPTWVENNLVWFMHNGKEHGFSDFPQDVYFDLIICPDAGSNDIQYHQALKELIS